MSLFAWNDRTYVMGILNVTPDSFSDGGRFNTREAAIAQAQYLIEGGVDILDVGGQSTRPGSVQISLQEELDRVIPVIQILRAAGMQVPISVDTTRASVAQAALEAGATCLNDISGATYEPEMLTIAAQTQVPIVLMHLRGTPATMQSLTDYDDVVAEVKAFLQTQAQRAEAAGIAKNNIILDPGIGFAKTFAQNIELLNHLADLKALGYPLLVGPSRKSFIGHILNEPIPDQRVWGTAAACCKAIAAGTDILRIDDREMVLVCRVADTLWRTSGDSHESN
ncbi:MAG: dihydropteroate synthase [Prochlorotrichaceae cyanobacterium]